MYKKTFFILNMLFIIIFLALIITGCGPAATEVVSLTPKPPTNTPPPTPTATPTPMSYNLSLNVNDGEGEPIGFATAIIGDQERITDENGGAVFEDLPDSSISLLVEASGYFPTDVTENIERGDNQLDVVLERDPFGLPVKDACAPGESLLYFDDFQDGAAQGWDAIALQTQGWSIETAPDQRENTVIAARPGAGWAQFGEQGDYPFRNAVWRLHFNYTGPGSSHINWRFNPEGGDTRYILGTDPNGNVDLRRFKDGNDITIGQVGSLGEGWHFLEISYYDGTVAVYLDGQEGYSWTDPEPWDSGTIGLEPYPEGEAAFYYDDLVVCELNAPFEPLLRPQTGYNLEVAVTDSEGIPISGVSVAVSELGAMAGAAQNTDASGQAFWLNLPNETATLVLNTPGYFPVEETLTIQKDDNQHSITLERDPFGLLPSEACRSEETLVYVDDFQDGKAQDWDAIELNIPGWSVESAPDQPENKVIAAREGASWAWFGGRNKYSFDNVVWRLNFNYSGRGGSHLNFRFVETGEKVARYIIAASRGAASLDRLESDNHVTIRPVGTPQGDEWHLLEIGFFDGTVYVYLDGVLRAEWEDSNPWEGGTLNLEPGPEAEAVFYYDNFSVCELGAPLQTITAAPE